MTRFFILAALLCANAANAHVVLEQKTAPAGSYYKGTFMVGHGCNGSPTTAIRVTVPDGVTGARPQPKAGWTVETATAPLAQPIESHGKRITEAVKTITWRGGPLLDTHYDEFVVMMKLPAGAGPLYFRVLQRCAQGENDWTQIPAAGQSLHELKTPAAVLELEQFSAEHKH